MTCKKGYILKILLTQFFFLFVTNKAKEEERNAISAELNIWKNEDFAILNLYLQLKELCVISIGQNHYSTGSSRLKHRVYTIKKLLCEVISGFKSYILIILIPMYACMYACVLLLKHIKYYDER